MNCRACADWYRCSGVCDISNIKNYNKVDQTFRPTKIVDLNKNGIRRERNIRRIKK